MTYCSNCGKSNIESAKYCGKCGSKISNVKSITTQEQVKIQNYDSDNMNYLQRLFIGRIGVGDYWIGLLSSMIMFVTCLVFLDESTDSILSYLAIIILIIYYLYLVSFTIKRAHDLEESGWTILLTVVPIINIYYGFRFCFTRGTPGDNIYGKYIPKDQNIWERVRRIYCI